AGGAVRRACQLALAERAAVDGGAGAPVVGAAAVIVRGEVRPVAAELGPRLVDDVAGRAVRRARDLALTERAAVDGGAGAAVVGAAAVIATGEVGAVAAQLGGRLVRDVAGRAVRRARDLALTERAAVDGGAVTPAVAVAQVVL